MSVERNSPLEIDPEDFRRLGHDLVDRIAGLLAALRDTPVARAATPAQVRAVLPPDPVPETGADPAELLAEASRLLFEYSSFNAHPRFFGYISGAPAPIGILADLLASAINANVSGWTRSPMASEIERQTIRWIAQLLDYPDDCGGLLVSGGNTANVVGILAARRAMAGPEIRTAGITTAEYAGLTLYASEETHVWIRKAADMGGFGTDAIHWIPTDDRQRMDVAALERRIAEDREAGLRPFLVVATAGTVGTGAIDPIIDIERVCRRENLWLHIDAAYGGPAVLLEDAPDDLQAIARADSIAIDPHKWLYAPLEAGSILVRDADALREAFRYRPTYYDYGEDTAADQRTNFFEWGPQNSRGFRALKVWLALRHAGRSGYRQMIADDIAAARAMYAAAAAEPEIQPFSCNLSITTFRYVPPHLQTTADEPDTTRTLNELNAAILRRIQADGNVFLSNAVVDGKYLLRACIVNFRTTLADAEAVLPEVVRIGRELTQSMK